MKKILFLLLLFSTCIVFLVACGVAGAPAMGNEVHMSANNFVQSSVTIKKGQSITLVDDSFVPHTIANGTWEHGSAHAGKEAGAPAIAVQIGSNSSGNIGPFPTAGTFQVYCTIHPGMNLTVIVQ